jgi:hypothetical protein
VAEGGSLIVARRVSCVGAFELDLRFWEGASLYGVGVAFLGRLSSAAAQPFSPAVVINGRKVARHTRVAAFRLLMIEEGECLRGGPGKLDGQGKRRYSPPHFPPHGLVLRARGEGGE